MEQNNDHEQAFQTKNTTREHGGHYACKLVEGNAGITCLNYWAISCYGEVRKVHKGEKKNKIAYNLKVNP